MRLSLEPGLEDFRRDAGHDGPRWDGPGDDGARADNGTLTDIGQDDRSVANPGALTYGNQLLNPWLFADRAGNVCDAVSIGTAWNVNA